MKWGTVVKVILYGVAAVVPCGGIAVAGFHLVKKYKASREARNIVEKENGELPVKRRDEEGETDLQKPE